MAETFVAVRRGPASFEQRVCLKRILPACAENPVFVELFLDEARLLGRLQCRNIVHVYDFGEVDGTYYMALELVDGVDLAHLLASLREHGQSMPQQVALYVVSEVLSALSYAHALIVDGEPMAVVHRDISPSNILISRGGEVKLTDFGIAQARGRMHRTQTGHTKGKVAYMSPEQIRAEPLDGRSDLFSLGVVLFELLTGVHPFDSTTDFAVQLSIMAGKRAALRELRPDMPADVAKLVDALLATRALDRPQTADDALALVPSSGSGFALQQQLAKLVAAPSEHGVPAPRVSVPAWSSRDLATASEQAIAALPISALPVSALPPSAPVSAIPSYAPAPASARATSAEPAPKRSPRLLLLVPLVILPLAAAYAFAQRGPGWSVPPLPWVNADHKLASPPTQDPARQLVGSPSQSAGKDGSTARRDKQAGPQLPPVEQVVSPDKGGARPSTPSVDEVVSPAKANPAPPRQTLDQVVTPRNGRAPLEPQPVESVTSPRTGREKLPVQPVELVISPPKGAAPPPPPH
jgi:serine/threonine protein kinase